MDKLIQCVKIPFETSSWVEMPATAPVDPVNSGTGTRTERKARSRACPGTGQPCRPSDRRTESHGAATRGPQVAVARWSPLPGSNRHPARAHPGKREETADGLEHNVSALSPAEGLCFLACHHFIITPVKFKSGPCCWFSIFFRLLTNTNQSIQSHFKHPILYLCCLLALSC